MRMKSSVSLGLSSLTVLSTSGELYHAGSPQGHACAGADRSSVLWNPVRLKKTFSSIPDSVCAVYTRGCLIAMLTADGNLLCANLSSLKLYWLDFPHAKVVQIALGEGFNVMLLESGIVMTYGRGKSGGLGHGDTCDKEMPHLVSSLVGHKVTQISAGLAAAAVTKTGKLFTWGKNYYGQLGQGHTTAQLKPRPVCNIGYSDSRVQYISCGDAMMMAVCNQGSSIYAWGGNNAGNMGVGVPGHGYFSPVAIDMDAFGSRKIATVSCATMHSLALTQCGALYASGQGKFGALGTGNNQIQEKFVPIKIDAFVTEISTNKYTSAALTDDGRLFTWGSAELPDEEFPMRRSVRLKEKNPTLTGICSSRATIASPTEFGKNAFEAAGVKSLGIHAFQRLTDEKKIAFLMGMHKRLARRHDTSSTFSLSSDIAALIFKVYM